MCSNGGQRPLAFCFQSKFKPASDFCAEMGPTIHAGLVLPGAITACLRLAGALCLFPSLLSCLLLAAGAPKCNYLRFGCPVGFFSRLKETTGPHLTMRGTVARSPMYWALRRHLF